MIWEPDKMFQNMILLLITVIIHLLSCDSCNLCCKNKYNNIRRNYDPWDLQQERFNKEDKRGV